MHTHWPTSLAVIAIAACATSCSDIETPIPGELCVRNSDCNDPLVCTYRVCHEACRDSDDCPRGQRCVWAAGTGPSEIASGTGVRVCLLPAQSSCALDSQCTPELVCGRDLQCRNECEGDRDCPDDDDRCLIAGRAGEKLCVEPNAIVDGGVPDLSDAAQDASGFADAQASDAGSDSAVDAANPADAGPREVDEVEPNDVAASANPYLLHSKVHGCLCSASDSDWYTFTVPEGDTAGGYFKVVISEVGSGAIFAFLSAASDQGRIGAFQSLVLGEGHQFYFAGAAGHTYLLQVVQAGVRPFTPFPYSLTAEYERIDDPFEPNNTRDAPSHITLNAAIAPFLYSGYETGTIPIDAYDDWYSVTLTAGMATVDLDDVPASLRLRFRVFDDTFSELRASDNTASNLGAEVHGSFSVAAPGTYRVVIQSLITVAGAVGEGDPPEHFIKPYRLTIGQ